MLKMESLFNQENKNGIMDEQIELMVEHQDSDHDKLSNSSSTKSSINENEDEDEKEQEEEVNSSCPLQDMSSLLQQLPLKRGLSKHYNGKSKSFTSLSNVGCLEDLVKVENPYNYNKRLKMYGGLPRNNTCATLIGKKGPNNNYPIVGGRRN